MNAFSCYELDNNTKSISTSSQELDEALQHGNRLGTLTEINGASGTGKTQLCLQLTINTILPEPIGWVGGDAVYISTKRNFCKQRVVELVDCCVRTWQCSDKNNQTKFTRNDALKKIRHRLVTDLPELIATIYQLSKFVEKTNTVSCKSFHSLVIYWSLF